MKLLLSFLLIWPGEFSFARPIRAVAVVAGDAADARQNLSLIVGRLRARGYLELTRQIAVERSVDLNPVPSSRPLADVEFSFGRRYRLSFGQLDPEDQRSIWTVALALAQIEVFERGLAAGSNVPTQTRWIERPTLEGRHRSDQVSLIINETYRLLTELDQLEPIEVLPEFDPASAHPWRALFLGSPLPGPNRFDYDRRYRPEGRGDREIQLTLADRYGQKFLIAAWLDQALDAVSIFPFHRWRRRTHLEPVATQTSQVVSPPKDPKAKAKVISDLRKLIDEVTRRKQENVRTPNTDHINEAKQAVIDFMNKKENAWLYAEPSVPRL